MNANQKNHPTRLQYMAAYATPHPWLWVLVPGAAWLILYVFRSSLDNAVYLALRSTIVLALVFSVVSVSLQLFGVRPAPKTRGGDAEPPMSHDSNDSPSQDSPT